jgi:hypothetical protein
MKYTAKHRNPNNRKNVSLRKNQRGSGYLDFLFGKRASGPNSSFNYPRVNLKYNGNPIRCEVCSTDAFFKVDISVDRSKTATLLTDAVLDEQWNQVLSHPLRMYVCTQCLWCKQMYAPTSWNGLNQTIVETPVTELVANPMGPAPAPGKTQ